MSEFKVSDLSSQTLHQLSTTYSLSGLYSQYATVAESTARVLQLDTLKMAQVTGPARICEVTLLTLRSARLRDMSKPVYLGELQSQSLLQVSTPATVSGVGMLVLQDQHDRRILPPQGGVFFNSTF